MKLQDYTHCAHEWQKEDLQEKLQKLWAAHISVLAAACYRETVPTSYQYTTGMHAPYFHYERGKGIRLIDGNLESRSYAARIPARFYVKGSETKPPKGFRCTERDRKKNIAVFIF